MSEILDKFNDAETNARYELEGIQEIARALHIVGNELLATDLMATFIALTLTVDQMSEQFSALIFDMHSSSRDSLFGTLNKILDETLKDED